MPFTVEQFRKLSTEVAGAQEDEAFEKRVTAIIRAIDKRLAEIAAQTPPGQKIKADCSYLQVERQLDNALSKSFINEFNAKDSKLRARLEQEYPEWDITASFVTGPVQALQQTLNPHQFSP